MIEESYGTKELSKVEIGITCGNQEQHILHFNIRGIACFLPSLENTFCSSNLWQSATGYNQFEVVTDTSQLLLLRHWK